MVIATDTDRNLKDLFDRFSPPDAEMEFERTHVPVSLACFGTEQLVSRSQAKRVLARFDRFREVMLDFEGVDWIGPAFADEIFRVYRKAHPEIELIAINTSDDMIKMIERARKAP